MCHPTGSSVAASRTITCVMTLAVALELPSAAGATRVLEFQVPSVSVACPESEPATIRPASALRAGAAKL